MRTLPRCTKEEICKRSTSALSVVAHHEHLRMRVLRGSLVELERSTVEPTGPGLFIVVETEPYMLELADFRVVLAPAEIDDVGYSHFSESFGVTPGRDGASER